MAAAVLQQTDDPTEHRDQHRHADTDQADDQEDRDQSRQWAVSTGFGTQEHAQHQPRFARPPGSFPRWQARIQTGDPNRPWSV